MQDEDSRRSKFFCVSKAAIFLYEYACSFVDTQDGDRAKKDNNEQGSLCDFQNCKYHSPSFGATFKVTIAVMFFRLFFNEHCTC